MSAIASADETAAPRPAHPASEFAKAFLQNRSALLGLLLLGLGALVGLSLGTGPQHGLRGDVLQGQAAAGRDGLGLGVGHG